MGDAATRFDKIVNTEEKRKRTNAFVKSNSTLKGASDRDDADIGNDAVPAEDSPHMEENVPEIKDDDNVRGEEKPKPVRQEKGKKNLVLDKSGKLDLKSLINARDGDSKSYSLYLKEKTYKELERLAKSQNVSVSRALNDILDSIL